MSRAFIFNFPLSRFSSVNNREYTRRGQADQITQEAAEAFSAAERDDERAYLVELLDCVHACETALAEFDDVAIAEAWQEVVNKNAERGYYSSDSMALFVDEKKGDPIDHPAHYEQNGVQTVEMIEAVIEGLPAREAFCLGSLLKYVIRAGRKGEISEDLGKANNFAHRLTKGVWRWQQNGNG